MMSEIGLIENQKLIGKFLEFCRGRGNQSGTIIKHRNILNGLCKYVSKPFQGCSESEWRTALNKRSAERGWGRRAIWQANSSVRAICRWMWETGMTSKPVIRRRPSGTGRPAAATISEMLPECDTSDPEQIVEYHGKPVSTLALAALWLAMADGFLARCAFLGEGERMAMRNHRLDIN